MLPPSEIAACPPLGQRGQALVKLPRFKERVPNQASYEVDDRFDPTDDFARFQVISFDLFDTLVIRTVLQPQDVFLVVERELVRRFGTRMRGFAAARRTAELTKARDAWAEHHGAEITLPQIYRQLAVEWPQLADAQDSVEAMNIELSSERTLCKRHERHGHVFEEALRRGKRVIIITDTYLPRELIESILRDAGFSRWERLFVSNEVGANKSSGSIYPKACEVLGVKPDDILHLGDNPRSDVEQARAAGLGARHLPPVRLQMVRHELAGSSPNSEAMSALDRARFEGLQASRYGAANDGVDRATFRQAFDFGYRMLGPLLFGFLHWTIRHARVYGVRELYFVARDGWFLKEAFDAMMSRVETNIGSRYLLASRRALRMTVLPEQIHESALGLVYGVRAPLRWILENFELDLEVSELHSFGFASLDQVLDGDDDYERLRRLFEHKTEQLRWQRENERGAYLEYLASVGIDGSVESVAVVDSGLYGTSQKALTTLLRSAGINARVRGLYVAVAAGGATNFTEDSSGLGFLYHRSAALEGERLRSLLEATRILEACLGAPASSLRRMKRTQSGVEPVFVSDAAPFRDPRCAAIQQGALGFIRDFAENEPDTPPMLPVGFLRSRVERLVSDPTAEEARLLGALPYDGSKLTREEGGTLLPPPGWGDFRRPRELIRAYYQSAWRAGFLASRDSSLAEKLVLSRSSDYRRDMARQLEASFRQVVTRAKRRR